MVQLQNLRRRNPLRMLDNEKNAPILPDGAFGAVYSRPGVGKTAFLVQIAIDAMLSGRNVLHIGLNDPVTKVDLWYKEMIQTMAKDEAPGTAEKLWDMSVPNRFITTFRSENFNLTTLRDRLEDMIHQQVFVPQLLIIDNINFENISKEFLIEFKNFVKENNLRAWFSISCPDATLTETSPFPAYLQDKMDLFDLIIRLIGSANGIRMIPQGLIAEQANADHLSLDPQTMLVLKKENA